MKLNRRIQTGGSHIVRSYAAALIAIVALAVAGACPSRAADPQDVLGSSTYGVVYNSWADDTLAIPGLNAHNAVGLNMTRISTSYNKSSNADLDSLVLACKSKNVTPLLETEYYAYWGNKIDNGMGSVYNYWYSVGRGFATRYQPNSPWLQSQGISNWGISIYSAMNEPDNAADFGVIPQADYYNAIKGYADGVHSVNSALKVLPGGYSRVCAYTDPTGGGYITTLVPLFNNGTLDGIDIHYYQSTSGSSTSLSGSYGPMAMFLNVKNTQGIIADINNYCTEFNYDDTRVSAQQQANWFLTMIWAELGVCNTTSNGVNNLRTRIAFPFDLSTLTTQQPWGMTVNFNPWSGDLRANTLKLVAQLTKGKSFTDAQPWNYGTYTLSGGGQTLWVLENHPLWTQGTRTSFTCSPLPAGTTQLQVYGWDGLRQTYNVSGQTSYTVTGLGNNDCYMFLASNGSTSTTLPNGTYKIVNKNSGKALTVSGNSTANGVNIVQATYTAANSQKWIFNSLGGGYYSIQNVNSGLNMDISGASTADGAANIQWPWNSGWNQFWSLSPAGNGSYNIVNRNSGKVLDITGASTADGAQDIQYYYNSGDNQRWYISAP